MRSTINDKYTNSISFVSTAKKINVTQAKLNIFAQTMFQSGSVTNMNGTILTSSVVTDYFKDKNIFDNILQKKYTQHFKNCIAQYNYPKCGKKRKIQTETKQKKVSNSVKYNNENNNM